MKRRWKSRTSLILLIAVVLLFISFFIWERFEDSNPNTTFDQAVMNKFQNEEIDFVYLWSASDDQQITIRDPSQIRSFLNPLSELNLKRVNHKPDSPYLYYLTIATKGASHYFLIAFTDNGQNIWIENSKAKSAYDYKVESPFDIDDIKKNLSQEN